MWAIEVWRGNARWPDKGKWQVVEPCYQTHEYAAKQLDLLKSQYPGSKYRLREF